MRYRTELMERILTDETAQEMIDWVSQRYGSSYVGLWLFQAIGSAFTGLRDAAEAMKAETSPSTANTLLPQWEAHYDLPASPDLPPEERRQRILRELDLWGPANPVRMEQTLSAMTGRPVRVTENTGPFAFSVELGTGPEAVNLDRVMAWAERIKPAHLQMTLANVAENRIVIKAACRWLIYTGRFCGTYPYAAQHGELVDDTIVVYTDVGDIVYRNPASGEIQSGTFPRVAQHGEISDSAILVRTAEGNIVYQNPASGEIRTGTFPDIATTGSVQAGAINAAANGQGVSYRGTVCGGGFIQF